jgi:hypothetical protein
MEKCKIEYVKISVKRFVSRSYSFLGIGLNTWVMCECKMEARLKRGEKLTFDKAFRLKKPRHFSDKTAIHQTILWLS